MSNKGAAVVELAAHTFLDVVQSEVDKAHDASLTAENYRDSLKFIGQQLRMLKAEMNISKRLTPSQSRDILDAVRGRLESYVLRYGNKHHAYVKALNVYDEKFMRDMQVEDREFVKRLAGVLVDFFKPEFSLELWDTYADR